MTQPAAAGPAPGAGSGGGGKQAGQRSPCVYAQLHAPTAVDMAASAFFTTPQLEPGQLADLILVRGTKLEVCSIALSSGDDPATMLRTVDSWQLWGVPESIAVLKSRVIGQRDAVLLSFRDARVATITWNTHAHTIHTSALHSFEKDGALCGGFRSHPRPPLVCADPDGRCAALLVRRNRLCVLPAADAATARALGAGPDPLGSRAASIFLPADAADATDRPLSLAAPLGPTSAPSLEDWPWREGRDLGMELGIYYVRDAVFLHGYAEPLLLVLHEVPPTAPGLQARRKDTCALSGISVGIDTGKLVVVWSAQGVPSDSFKLVPTPKGGALVLTNHAIVHFAQGQQPSGVTVSDLAHAGKPPPHVEKAVAPEIQYLSAGVLASATATELDAAAESRIVAACRRAQGIDASLHGCGAAWLGPTACALGLRDGRLLTVTLDLSAGGTCTGVHIRHCPGPAAARCLVALPWQAAPDPDATPGLGAENASAAPASGLCFLGSRTGDSFLLKYRPAEEAGGEDGDGDGQGRTKRARVDGGGGAEDMPETEVVGGDLDVVRMIWGDQGAPDLSAGARVRQSGLVRAFAFEAVDQTQGLAPIRDAALGDQAETRVAGARADQRLHRPKQLVCCVGDGRASGALAILRQSLSMDSVLDMPLTGVTGVWAIHLSDDKLSMPVDARAALRGYAEGDHPPTSVASGAAEGEGAGTGDVEMQEGGPGAETGKGAAGAVPGEGAVTGKQGRAQATRAVMWEGGEGDGGGPGAAEQLRVGCAPDHHGLLLASTFGETRVFQTGTRLREATEELSAQLPGSLLLVASVCQGDLVLAAHPGGLILLEPCRNVLRTVAEVTVEDLASHAAADGAGGLKEDEDVEVLAASQEGNSVAAVLSNGVACVVHAVAGAGRVGGALVVDVSPAMRAVLGRTADHVSAACLYEDSTGWLARCLRGPHPRVRMPEYEDAFENIYGKEEEAKEDSNPTCGTVLVVARESGALEMLEVTEQTPAHAWLRDKTDQADGTGARVHFSDLGTALRDVLLCSSVGDGPWVLAHEQGQSRAVAKQAAEEEAAGAGPRGGSGAADGRARHVVQVVMGSFGPCARLHVGTSAARGGSGPSDGAAARPPAGPWPGASPTTSSGAAAGAGVGGVGRSRGTPSAPWTEIPRSDAPILALVTSDGAVQVLRAFHPSGTHELRFRRLQVRVPWQRPWVAEGGQPAQLRRCLVRFDDLGPSEGACGFLVCGPAPCWVVVHRGTALVHPCGAAGGGVLCATPLHIPDCAHGVVLGMGEAGVVLGEVPRGFRITSPWVSKKVMLRSTPLRACFYAPARLFAIALEDRVPYDPNSDTPVGVKGARYKPLERADGTDPAAAAAYETAAAAARRAGEVSLQRVRLFDPTTWAPLCQFSTAPGEAVMALRAVAVKATEGEGRTDAFLAVATAMSHGEDFPVYGRIVLLSVLRKKSVTAEEQTLGKVWEVPVQFSQQFLGAVTDLEQMDGRIVAAIGHRIEVLDWTGRRLQARHKFDGQDMIPASLRARGKHLAASDFIHGVRLLHVVPERVVQDRLFPESLAQAGLHTGCMVPHAIEFLPGPEDAGITLVASDALGCLHLFRQPPQAAGLFAQRMQHVGRFHLGAAVERLLSVPVPATTAALHPAALLCAALDGSVGVLSTLSAPAADLLRELQRASTPRMVHAAGLHPSSHRGSEGRGPAPPTHGTFTEAPPPAHDSVVDGDLLGRFLSLPASRRLAICARAGVDAQEAVSLLEEIQRAWWAML